MAIRLFAPPAETARWKSATAQTPRSRLWLFILPNIIARDLHPVPLRSMPLAFPPTDRDDGAFPGTALAAMAAILSTVWTWREGAAPVARSAASSASAGS